MRTLSFIFLFLLVMSCVKEELPKPLSAAPSANTISVKMGSDYANQLYFNLASGSVISQDARESWDLGFETGIDGRQVILNTSKAMQISKTTFQDLSSVSAGTPVTWIHDNPTGKADSLAFSGWELNKVYIVDKGVNTLGQPLGKVKLRITAVSDISYTVEWAELAETTSRAITITKANDFNFSFLSFKDGGKVVAVEPEKTKWDLVFTTYTNIFADGTPYQVTGILTNRNEVRALKTATAFDEVNYAFAASQTYPADLNSIGYDWKTYDINAAVYTIQFNNTYLVKSVEGRYYKLRFLDFYDENGTKGTPSFELQELTP